MTDLGTAPEVGFRADGGDAPLTIGQRNVLRWLTTDDDPRGGTLPAFVPVPPVRTAAEVTAVLRALLVRHEALRTVFPGGGIQRVLAAGTVPVAVHELVGDPYRFVGGLVLAALAEPFDVTAEPPVRALLVTDRGAPSTLVLLLSHAAVDAAGAAIVQAQAAALLAGAELGPVRHQPRDQAAWEASTGGQRRVRSALRHWETVLRRVPAAMLPEPHPAGRPGQREVRMRSAALAGALPVVAARTGAGPSTVLLAATAALVAARTGVPAGAVVSICGNRFRADWRDYVGPLAQDALVPYTVGGSVDDLVRQVRGATLSAYRHAQFDPVALWAVIDAVGRDRGAEFRRDLVFNDLAAHDDLTGAPAGPPHRPGPTVLEPMPERVLPTALLVTLGGVSRAEVDLRAYADTRYLPDVEDFLLGLEALVVAAAADPAHPAGAGPLGLA